MKRLRKWGKTIAGMLFILSVLSACWIGAHYLMNWGYWKLGGQPNGLLRQLLTSIGGFIFFGLIMMVVGAFMQKKQKAFFQEMNDALKRISKGDFRVNLNGGVGTYDYQLGQLVEGINDMAVNLKAMEDMRQEFISNVSHEIQSPLTSISGFARAMIYEELHREEQLQYLQIIEVESTRLSKLSDDLLRLASLDSEHHPFHPIVYRLDKQLQSQILAFEPQWLNKQLDIEVNMIELSVNADPNLLSQVWVNLIHNAVKFTPENGIISIRLEQQAENTVVSITDTGIGILEEEQRRIFERFFKADKSRLRSAGGSGLGLSIVHKIVRMHQGDITVSSKLGEGTTFTITLPITIPPRDKPV